MAKILKSQQMYDFCFGEKLWKELNLAKSPKNKTERNKNVQICI